jgi:hypothetical protein
VANVDVGAGPVQVALTATDDTLTLNGTGRLESSAVDGTAGASMTVTGPLSTINRALHSLPFAPSPNSAGAAALQTVTNDHRNTGVGGAQSDTDTVGTVPRLGHAVREQDAGKPHRHRLADDHAERHPGHLHRADERAGYPPVEAASG